MALIIECDIVRYYAFLVFFVGGLIGFQVYRTDLQSTILVTTPFVLLILGLILVCYVLNFVYYRLVKIPCMICKQMVIYNKEHRVKCANEQEALIATFEVPHADLICPRCHTTALYLLPVEQDGGRPFKCSRRYCNSRSVNSGHNRYTCFPCGYSLCQKCAIKTVHKMEVKRKEAETGQANPCWPVEIV